jgi:enamine deaminase RidA (YjgF/YER057c/UK114 family)
LIEVSAGDTTVVASRAVLKDIHTQVRATLTRIDATLSEIRARERALTDGSFRAQVVAETRAWFDSHPEEVQGIMDLFAPQARRRELPKV